jgi:hypothetical protein
LALIAANRFVCLARSSSERYEGRILEFDGSC